MNYGAEPADQVVRYSLEGTEVALRLSGSAAITFAKFVAAILKDQKKVHGKTRLVRLLREGKPLKFFSVEKERMREFAHEAKMHGLLFVPMRDKTDPDHIEIAILADDASKVNRIFDRLQLEDRTSELQYIKTIFFIRERRFVFRLRAVRRRVFMGAVHALCRGGLFPGAALVRRQEFVRRHFHRKGAVLAHVLGKIALHRHQLPQLKPFRAP